MIQCPKCSAQLPDESKFCLSCGESLSSLSQAPTVAAPERESPQVPVQSPYVGRIVSSDSVPAGGFTPGTILVDRYRVIGLLGRGGMGEVYRADDLKLGQPVALKFLPPKLSEDPVRREHFFAEVRITRQLSHPNICRVYDIGEVEGRHFLSMEYIDGEDLASLMKRIGHLSNEKALDIARQLVAGLSVAHERGVLHRDLKPANIMLDGHGRVRITDFGLAIAAEDESQTEEIAGTPAYMAPEQLAGKGATVRSDIYSLGLILYEIYTGKKAFKARTLAELREQKETQTPRAPSELREGIDPVVERVIQRCIEKDPSSRPSSVAHLAQTLPGGDPLAAAIAAGETPSPEMVAASGSKEGLRPAVAWGLLVFIIIGTIALLWMNDRAMLHRRIPFEKHPQHLLERAREVIKNAGYPEEFADCDFRFGINDALLRHIRDVDKSADRWERLDSQAIGFTFRQSPLPIEATIIGNLPLLEFSGEIQVILDTEGHLRVLEAIPPQQAESETGTGVEFDWNVLLAEAGLDPSQWTPTDPQRIPRFYADDRAAWQGSLPGWPGTTFRIEAATFQGKPVYFEVIGPWTQSTRTELVPFALDDYVTTFLALLLVAIIGCGLFFAIRNLRLGRGDRRSANRLALLTIGLLTAILILTAHHVLTFWELVQIVIYVSLAISAGGSVWILYIAIEPYVRRRWPQVLISWARIISGNWRDPLVARDVLIGCASGVLLFSMFYFLCFFVPPLFGYAEIFRPMPFLFGTVLGISSFVSTLLFQLVGGIFISLAFLCLLFILRILLRNQKVAFTVFVLIFASLTALQNIWLFPIGLFTSCLILFVLMRFGLIALVFIMSIESFFDGFPTTLEVSAWYAGYGYAALAIFAAIVLYAFYTSLGGQPMFGTPRLDD